MTNEEKYVVYKQMIKQAIEKDAGFWDALLSGGRKLLSGGTALKGYGAGGGATTEKALAELWNVAKGVGGTGGTTLGDVGSKFKDLMKSLPQGLSDYATRGYGEQILNYGLPTLGATGIGGLGYYGSKALSGAGKERSGVNAQ